MIKCYLSHTGLFKKLKRLISYGKSCHVMILVNKMTLLWYIIRICLFSKPIYNYNSNTIVHIFIYYQLWLWKGSWYHKMYIKYILMIWSTMLIIMQLLEVFFDMSDFSTWVNFQSEWFTRYKYLWNIIIIHHNCNNIILSVSTHK